MDRRPPEVVWAAARSMALRKLRTTGQAVVMVTRGARMSAYADRVVFLRDGRVVDEEQIRPVA